MTETKNIQEIKEELRDYIIKLESRYLRTLAFCEIFAWGNEDDALKALGNGYVATITNEIKDGNILLVMLNLVTIYSYDHREYISIKKILKKIDADVEESLANDARSWSDWRAEKDYNNVKRWLSYIRTKVEEIVSSPEYKLIEHFRHTHIAHSLDQELKHFPKYGEVKKLLDDTEDIIEKLLLCIAGTSTSLKDYRDESREAAGIFWMQLIRGAEND